MLRDDVTGVVFIGADGTKAATVAVSVAKIANFMMEFFCSGSRLAWGGVCVVVSLT